LRIGSGGHIAWDSTFAAAGGPPGAIAPRYAIATVTT
jgi:hypothetical protein